MSAHKFQVRYETPTAGQNVILFSGPLNEKSELGNVRIPFLLPNTMLYIDTHGVSSINSIGTRDFANWIRQLKNTYIIFSRCPKVFVDQLNMMPGFIPIHSRVSSFYVPFSTAGELDSDFDEKHVLYSFPNHFRRDAGHVTLTHIENLTDKNGKLMNLDVVPEKYFRFLDLYCPTEAELKPE